MRLGQGEIHPWRLVCRHDVDPQRRRASRADVLIGDQIFVQLDEGTELLRMEPNGSGKCAPVFSWDAELQPAVRTPHADGPVRVRVQEQERSSSGGRG